MRVGFEEDVYLLVVQPTLHRADDAPEPPPRRLGERHVQDLSQETRMTVSDSDDQCQASWLLAVRGAPRGGGREGG